MFLKSLIYSQFSGLKIWDFNHMTNFIPKKHNTSVYFLVAKLLYKSKCPSVCPYIRQPRLGGNVIFSASNWDLAPIFFVQIPLINEHLFCKYFVRLSVGNATKGFVTFGCFHPCLLIINLYCKSTLFGCWSVLLPNFWYLEPDYLLEICRLYFSWSKYNYDNN